MNHSNRHFLLISYILLVLNTIGRVNGHIYNFSLSEPECTKVVKDVPFRNLNFTFYVDPLKTNWIAWSNLPRSREVGKRSLIELPDFKGAEAPGGFTVKVTDPQGRTSPPLLLHFRDEQGIPVGQQAVFYGNREVTPWVAVRDQNGEQKLVNEEGIANEFFRKSPPGYYKFQIEFEHEITKNQLNHSLYMLMDVVEGFRFPAPALSEEGQGYPFLFDRDHDEDDDDDNNESFGPGSGFPGPIPSPTPEFPPVPTPTSTPIVTPTPVGDLPIGGDFPNAPDYPGPPPVIPEPATLALSALGLGMFCFLGKSRRKGRRSKAKI